MIGQGDSMGVATEIGEDLLGTGEGPLRVHDPIDVAQATEEAAERAAMGEACRARSTVSSRALYARWSAARDFARKTIDKARTETGTPIAR